MLRQISKCRACSFNCLSYAGDLVSRKVVHDDDVFALERWSQTLLDIRQECFSGHCPIEHEGRRDSTVTQSGHEGDCLPVSVWHATDQPLAAWATAAKPPHFSIGRGLVDEYQSGRFK